MPTTDKTIDHGTLRRLVDAGAHVGAEVVGAAGGWGVVINHGRARQTLAVTRGNPRTLRLFETLAGYLKTSGSPRSVSTPRLSSRAPGRRIRPTGAVPRHRRG